MTRVDRPTLVVALVSGLACIGTIAASAAGAPLTLTVPIATLTGMVFGSALALTILEWRYRP